MAATAAALSGEAAQATRNALAANAAAALPTSTPAPTSVPTATPIPGVEPVADGKYMILVADLESAAQTSRDYARDITDDLKLN